MAFSHAMNDSAPKVRQMKSRLKQVPAGGPSSEDSAAGKHFSIPDAELTPGVSAAISGLLQEIRRLEERLHELQSRLQELLRTADQDMLLPVLNRRALMREVARFIAFAERYGTLSSLLFLDINGFKAVNDAHGHAAGDFVLRHFCEFLAGNIRSSDILSRMGGDEFAIIFPATTAQQARDKGKLLSRLLIERPLLWENKPVRLAFACGACELLAGLTAEDVLAEADREMYAAKRSASSVAILPSE
jgi:diguanylate cyclase (GGDEF)-like protein